MKFSIITPSLNQGLYLEQTIDSVLSQGVDVEYVVVDGGSKDNSIEIIKKYEKYLAYWISEPDGGQSNAINKGIKRATGNIINWLNSDDYLQPNALRNIREHFLNPNTDVVAGRSNIVTESKIVRQSNGTDLYEENLPKTIGQARIDQPETFYRKTIFDKLGPLNEQLHFVMDKEFWIRYLIAEGLNRVTKISDILANFRLHADSKTVSKPTNFWKEENAILYQIATTNNLDHLAHVISQSLPMAIIHKPAKYLIRSQDLAQQTLDYFLLYRADEYYYQNEHSRCTSLLSAITPQSLKKEDLELYKRLCFRSAFVPVFLKNLLRRWK